MNASGTQRLLAYGIDYLVLAVYGGGVFLLTILIFEEPRIDNPWLGQAVGFAVLTLPVVLYFVLSEASRWQATFGKRALALRVTDDAGARAPVSRLLIRNAVKFLPWEIAHTGVHQIVSLEATRPDAEVPPWLLALLLAPLAIGAWYVLSLFTSTGHTPYDRVAMTRVVYSRA